MSEKQEPPRRSAAPIKKPRTAAAAAKSTRAVKVLPAETLKLSEDRSVIMLNKGLYVVVHRRNGVEQVVSGSNWRVYTGPAATTQDEAEEVPGSLDSYEEPPEEDPEDDAYTAPGEEEPTALPSDDDETAEETDEE